MKTGIVFYSLENNTRAAVELLAKRLEADTYEIKTVKNYPKRGIAKFFVGGKDSTFGKLPQIQPLDVDVTKLDLLVLALPVWAGKAAAPINSFLEGRSFGTTKIALVICSASGDASSCAQDLAVKLGRAKVNLPTLSLKNPAKMDQAELSAQVDAFAERLEHDAGGAF